MFSTVALVGIMTIFVVSILVPLIWLLVCVKKVKNNSILFVVVLGLAAMGVANSLSTLVGAFKPMYDLAVSGKVGNFILYLLVSALAIALLETLVRYLTINYAFKLSGDQVGFYRAMAAGVGLGAGFVMINATDYIEMFVQAQLINAGDFIEMVTTGESAITVAEAEEYIAQLTSQHSIIYYIQALDRALIVLLEVTLVLLLTKFMMEGRKGLGFLFTCAIRFLFEFVRLILNYLADEYLGSLVSATVEVVLFAIFIVVIACLCVLTIYIIRTRKLLPEDKVSGPSKKVREKQQQDKRAWSEMRNLSQKNLSKLEFQDPYEKDEAVSGDKE